jgi:hypothetical protein
MNTFPKFPALPREMAAPMAKQEGHLKVAATEEKEERRRDGSCLRQAGRRYLKLRLAHKSKLQMAVVRGCAVCRPL